MNEKIAYLADTIYTGVDLLRHHAVVTVNHAIDCVVPAVAVEEDTRIINYGNAIITAPFIDLQLYGAYGRLLSAYPDAFTVSEIYRYSKSGGAAYCMPTVASNTYETIFKCIDAIKNYWQQGGKGVIGLHVEGPWISKEKKGAHNEAWIFSPTIEQATQLLDYGKGIIKLITLAPEVCAPQIIELIRNYNVTVCAGHSNATCKQAKDAFTNGVDVVTHLYNAMSPLFHREPGLVGATLDHPLVKASIVADGYHVDFAAIRIAKKILGERLYAITDAVTETHEGFYQHVYSDDKYTSNGILSGSALTMNKIVRNLVQHVNISEEEALRMCNIYPARIIKKSDEIALLKKGYPAQLTVLDKDYNVIEVID